MRMGSSDTMTRGVAGWRGGVYPPADKGKGIIGARKKREDQKDGEKK